jgi:hypothetical protein
MNIELNDTEQEAFRLYCENEHKHPINETPDEAFFDAYMGVYDTFKDFIEELFRERNEIPAHLDSYIDWDQVVYDWECSGDFWSEKDTDGDVHVFRSC